MVQDVFETYMVNFGTLKYSGHDYWIAQANAEATGFECVVHKNGNAISSYSPISGWRHF